MNVEVRRIHPTDAKIRYLHRWWLPRPEPRTGSHRGDQSGHGGLVRGLGDRR